MRRSRVAAERGDQLAEALGVSRGIVCTVGAGGKKSTLYRLAAELRGRVGLTTTTRTAVFPKTLEAHVVIAGEDAIASEVIEAASRHRVIAFAHPAPDTPARVGGLTPEAIVDIHRRARFDVSLIKADGARLRLIKAPAEGEPAIPREATLVIPIVSARAIGQPLSDEIAHRLDHLQAVTGARPGERVTPEHVAALLADERGALKNVGGARVVPIINMVDDAEREALAVAAAELALQLSDRFSRVLLCSMLASQPLVRIVDAANPRG